MVLIFSNNVIGIGDSQSKSRCSRRCKEVRVVQGGATAVQHSNVRVQSVTRQVGAFGFNGLQNKATISGFGRFCFNTNFDEVVDRKRREDRNLLDLANLGFFREFEQIDLSCLSFIVIQLNSSSWLTDTLLAPGCDFVVELRSP